MEAREKEQATTEGHGFGVALGVVTFLGGVALLVLTFKLAYDLFQTPPADVLAVGKDNTVDLGRSGSNFASVIIRVLLLIVMGLMGSLVANRGVTLFTESRKKRDQ